MSGEFFAFAFAFMAVAVIFEAVRYELWRRAVLRTLNRLTSIVRALSTEGDGQDQGEK
jgi:ethanolamine utilization cobalamin adenosyltransferase